MNYTIRICVLLSALVVMPLIGAAKGLEIEDAWVRMPPPVADTAAVYLNLVNSSEHPVQIKSVSSDVSKSAEFHSMMMHGDMMHMAKMGVVKIEAGQTLSFSPSGNHLMLIDLERSLNAGAHVVITIEDTDGKTYVVHAEVRDMRKMGHDQQQHHHHGH